MLQRKIFVGTLLLAIMSLAVNGLAAPSQAAPSNRETAPMEALQLNTLHLFEAQLSGMEVDPPVITEGRGRAVMVLDDVTNILYYRVVVWDLTDITGAHIDDGGVGEDRTIVVELFPTGEGEEEEFLRDVSGSVEITEDQKADMLAESYFVDIQTGANTEGEVRGQIVEYIPGDFNTILSGEEETPPVDTPASGWAHFSLNETFDTLTFEIRVADLEPATAAHLHPGWPGEAGPPEVTLYAPADPGADPFDPDNPLTGSVELMDPVHVLNLISGFYYLNVHTAQNPGGEIRGQVQSGYHTFRAQLSGENQPEPVDTEASGEGVAVLAEDMSTVYMRVMVQDILDITEAGIYLGQPGEEGTLVVSLFPLADEPFDPDNPIAVVINLAPEGVTEMVAGNYHINILTEANVEGEIRGQIERYTPVQAFQALLEEQIATQQVNQEGAAGTGLFMIDPVTGMNRLHYFVEVTEAVTVTEANIHAGGPAEDGPAVIPIYPPGDERDFDPDNPIGGDVDITAADLLDLLTGFLYLSVITDGETPGELRGQIEPVTLHQVVLPLIMQGFASPQE